MRKTLVVIASIAIIIIVSWVLMSFFKSQKDELPEKKNKEKITYVKAEPVSYARLQSEITATGRISSREYVDVISEVSGKILQGNVPLKKGRSFRKGQVLVRIFSEEAKLALKGHKSRFLNSIAGLLPDFKIDYPQSYGAWKKFFESVKLDEELPEMPEIKSDQEKIYLSSRNILSDYYSIKSEEIRLTKYTIRAPFNGSYTDVMLEVGSVANIGSRIAKMIRTDQLELEVPVEQMNARLIKVGSKALALSEDGETEWVGRVNRKANFVDPQTQSINVYISLSSSSSKPLFKGQYLRANFSEIGFNNVMEIPRNAVFNHDEMFTVVDGKLEKKSVNIIKVNAESYLINGLVEGTKIVTEPLVNVHENMEVRILGEEIPPEDESNRNEETLGAKKDEDGEVSEVTN